MDPTDAACRKNLDPHRMGRNHRRRHRGRPGPSSREASRKIRARQFCHPFGLPQTIQFLGSETNLEQGSSFGWLAGFAYEIPDIAARIALTYQSEIMHKFDSTEMFPDLPGVPITGIKESKTPQSINLDFPTGVAQNTLVFDGIRWADYSGRRVAQRRTDRYRQFDHL